MPYSSGNESLDRFKDTEAEKVLAKTMRPLVGICATCAAELAEDPHADWCPDR